MGGIKSPICDNVRVAELLPPLGCRLFASLHLLALYVAMCGQLPGLEAQQRAWRPGCGPLGCGTRKCSGEGGGGI